MLESSRIAVYFIYKAMAQSTMEENCFGRVCDDGAFAVAAASSLDIE